MSHEHKVALEKIVKLCEKSRSPTRRTESIHEIALQALGLTAGQRRAEIEAVRQNAEREQRALIQKRTQAYQEAVS